MRWMVPMRTRILFLSIALLFACRPVRDTLIVAGGGPARGTCPELADAGPDAPRPQRCNGLVPEALSTECRWWPSLPRRPDGTPRACTTDCAINPAGEAYCVADDAGATAP